MRKKKRETPKLLPPQLRPTPQQVLGPYFLPNSPITRRLFPATATGSLVKVSGQVTSTDCKPLSGATIHVWVANPQGHYDNEDASGKPLPIPQKKQLYRGRIFSDADGNYDFECLRPGNYFDSGWNLWRPAHLHIKVEASGYEELVTQLYFDDDAQNSHDIPGDDFFQPELALQLAPAIPKSGVTQVGIYNFVLVPAGV
jgi:protocatechuate 3,4-dioxygenase beta subunit